MCFGLFKDSGCDFKRSELLYSFIQNLAGVIRRGLNCCELLKREVGPWLLYQIDIKSWPRDKVSPIRTFMIVSILVIRSRWGGVTCLEFGYVRAAGVPGPHPIHVLVEVKNKGILILPIAKIVPIYLPFFKFYPFKYIYFGELDTPLIHMYF